MNVNFKTAAVLLLENPRLFARKSVKKVLVESSRWAGYPRLPVTRRLNGLWFRFDDDRDPLTRDMLFEAYEMPEVDLIRRTLRPGDTFVDVGANVGYLSCLAAGCVGQTGQVHCFEPVPVYFQELAKMAAMNPAYRFILNPCALGEEEGTAPIQVTRINNRGWNTMVPGFMPPERIGSTIEVPVRRLDRYLHEQRLDRVRLIKIDTEGFEYPILKGLESYLARPAPHEKPLLLVELSPPRAYALLGASVGDVFDYLARFSYHGYSTINLKKRMSPGALAPGVTNVLFQPS